MTIYTQDNSSSSSNFTLHKTTALRLQSLLSFLPSSDKAFATSLITWVLTNGRTWSPKQKEWADKLEAIAQSAKNNEPKAKPKQFPNIAKLFSNALASGLAWPKITYILPTYECPLVLAYVPRYDCIQVKCNNQLKGTIKMPNGIEDMRWPIKAGFFSEELARIETDPVAAAVISGKETSYCCFCNKHLTDERSVVHGYGPVCAANYDLPWDDGTVKKGSTKVSYKLAKPEFDDDIPF